MSRTTAPDGARRAAAFVRNQGDAWRCTLEALERELDTLLLVPESEAPQGRRGVRRLSALCPELLGRRTAEMHRAFATPTDDPAFAVEPLTLADLRAVAQDARAWAERAFAAVSRLAAGRDGGRRAAIEELRPGARPSWR